MPLGTSPLRKLFLRRLFSVSLPKLQPALGLDVARPGPRLTELSLDIPALPRLKPTFDNPTLPSLHNTGVGLPSSIFTPSGRRGETSPPIDGWRGAVLLVRDVLTPRDGNALLVNFLHGEVGHEAGWG